MKEVREGKAKMVSEGDEPLSPAAKLFHAPSFNCYVMAIMGCKTSINPQVIKEGLCQTLLKHPRFTSKLVKKGRKSRWTTTTVNIDNHVIVAEIDSKIELPDRFVEDYVSNITKTPLDLSKPLWELHILNIKTSDAEAVAIFRIHHSMGDGASLMSLLLASTRKISDPHALPTVPSKKRVMPDNHNVILDHTIISRFRSLLLAIWWGFVLIWHTLLDLVVFSLSIFFIKDTWTPLKGAPGVELNTKRFMHRAVSMEDIKLVKDEMKMTINDVLFGVTQAGLSRYLNRECGVNANAGAEKQRFSVPKKIRLRASVLVNIRPVAGIQDLADMMAEKSKTKWGNGIGYIVLPLSIALQEDPLQYVHQAKATVDRKKHSLEAICTHVCAKLILNLFGVKIIIDRDHRLRDCLDQLINFRGCDVSFCRVYIRSHLLAIMEKYKETLSVAAAITRRVLYNTTVAFSNVLGPVEEIGFYGHPVAYIAPSVYGHPQALTFHFQSYANKMIISISVDPSVIPDPYILCDDLEESLKLIVDAVQKKHIMNAVV